MWVVEVCQEHFGSFLEVSFLPVPDNACNERTWWTWTGARGLKYRNDTGFLYSLWPPGRVLEGSWRPWKPGTRTGQGKACILKKVFLFKGVGHA